MAPPRDFWLPDDEGIALSHLVGTDLTNGKIQESVYGDPDPRDLSKVADDKIAVAERVIALAALYGQLLEENAARIKFEFGDVTRDRFLQGTDIEPRVLSVSHKILRNAGGSLCMVPSLNISYGSEGSYSGGEPGLAIVPVDARAEEFNGTAVAGLTRVMTMDVLYSELAARGWTVPSLEGNIWVGR